MCHFEDGELVSHLNQKLHVPMNLNFYTYKTIVSTLLYWNVNLHPILQYIATEAAEDGKYSILAAMKSSKVLDYITPE